MTLFRRKPRNRRHGAGQVLDVKLRSDQVRAGRLRFAGFFLAMVCGTFLAFYGVWRVGHWALDCLIYNNQAFAVEKIDVRTDGIITLEQLRRWSGVKLGDNLFALDISRVKGNLERMSAVRSASVEKGIPHTIRLRIQERQPIAQIPVLRLQPDGASQPATVQIDGDGYIMNPLDPAQTSSPAALTNDVLPVVYGLDPADIKLGHRVTSPQVLAALRLLGAFDRSALSGIVDILEVDVSAPDVLQVTTSQRSKIVFPTDDPDKQLRRWREIRDYAQLRGQALVSLDLSVSGNSPAILTNAAAMPPAGSRNNNLQHPRRKNV